MEKYVNKSTLDKINFIHFGFIISVFLVLSFFVFDINYEDERSFTFFLLSLFAMSYNLGTDRFSTAEFIKTTDYKPSQMFSVICLCWWVAYTDYFVSKEDVSKFTGFFLILAFIATFGISIDFIHYFSDKQRKSIVPMFVIRPTQVVLLLTIGAIFYFFIYGTWSFHLGYPFDYLSRVMRGH